MGNGLWRHTEGFEEEFEVKEVLGRGASAEVKRCVHRGSNKEFAVKIIQKRYVDPKGLEKIKEEVKILEMIDHPNVVHLEAVFESKDRLYIVLEL
jgi:serine/threonine protein kinase